jgi:hypothetical protein
MDAEPKRKRRFQFRLRTLLIGVTLFCVVVCGYIVRPALLVRERNRLLEEFLIVANPFEDDKDLETLRERVSHDGVGWLRRSLGDTERPFFIVSKKMISAEDLQRVEGAFPESEIMQER